MSVDGRRAKVRVKDLTLGIYETVIDDTVSRIKAEFVQEGVDESVLEELRDLWEQNILKSGVIGRDEIEENPPQGGKTEAALPIVGNSSSAPPEDVSLTGQEPPSGLHVAIQPAPAAPEVVLNPASLKIERPPHLAVHSQPVQYQALSMDKGGHAPLGLVKKVSETQQVVTNTTGVIGQKRPREEEVGNGDGDDADVKLGAPPPSIIPQYDGAGEHDEGANEGKSGSDNDDDLLNEEDDLADADDHEEVDEDSIKNVILGQFDKVHRTKAKWRINLKNCVATVNGRDYLLKKVTGEMNFA